MFRLQIFIVTNIAIIVFRHTW